MKKLLIITALAAGSFLMARCTPKASKAVAASPEGNKEQPMSKDQAMAAYTAQQLESGRMLFTGNCAQCHGLKEPGSRTPEQWEKVLKRMIPKAKLNEEDGKLVKAYLIAHSKQG